jgi:hypothetical protein
MTLSLNHTVNLRQVADYLRDLPEPEKPALRRWRNLLLLDAVTHLKIPTDREIHELIYVGATTVFGSPAWRYAGSVQWLPGDPPSTVTQWIELGIRSPLPVLTDSHPRAIDGDDYPDDLPLPTGNPLLPFMQWALPATVAIGGALYWISR